MSRFTEQSINFPLLKRYHFVCIDDTRIGRALRFLRKSSKMARILAQKLNNSFGSIKLTEKWAKSISSEGTYFEYKIDKHLFFFKIIAYYY